MLWSLNINLINLDLCRYTGLILIVDMDIRFTSQLRFAPF